MGRKTLKGQNKNSHFVILLRFLSFFSPQIADIAFSRNNHTNPAALRVMEFLTSAIVAAKQGKKTVSLEYTYSICTRFADE